MREVTGQQWAALFSTFERSAWRWEHQGTYYEPNEVEPWRKFRDGEPDELEWMADWLAGVRSATDAGRTFGRVRVITDPPTDYLRWEMHLARVNIEAGEDIRVLGEHQARELALPEVDFWLFDDTLVAVMHFSDEGFTHATLHDEPEAVQRYRDIRDTALAHARVFTADMQFTGSE
ncbi:MAG: DUF6879 family protein [Sciscionella sp.]